MNVWLKKISTKSQSLIIEMCLLVPVVIKYKKPSLPKLTRAKINQDGKHLDNLEI